VRLNDDRSGYTMCFPSDYACSSMQSNLAATLNIDWLMDIAREAAEMAGAKTSRSALLLGLDDKVLATPPGQAVYHPYIFEAGERGPFLDPDARAQFSGLSTRTSFAGLARAVFEGLAFAARDCYLASGSIPREVRLGGGIARDAVGRGLSVLLCEKDDLAQGTSSRSGKLVHGGLRYLEYYEFRLVREALIEREVLLRAAPHVIWPMRFRAAAQSGTTPGLDGQSRFVSVRSLRRAPRLTADTKPGPVDSARGRASRKNFKRAFEYSAYWVDAARLVVLNAVDVRKRGGAVLTGTSLVSARRTGAE
jgi:hypothetical protein